MNTEDKSEYNRSIGWAIVPISMGITWILGVPDMAVQWLVPMSIIVTVLVPTVVVAVYALIAYFVFDVEDTPSRSMGNAAMFGTFVTFVYPIMRMNGILTP